MSSHKKKLEQLAYGKVQVKGQLSEQFYDETENLDAFTKKNDDDDDNKQIDAQYNELLQGISSQKKSSQPSDLSENPKYKGKSVSAREIFNNWQFSDNEISSNDDDEQEEGNQNDNNSESEDLDDLNEEEQIKKLKQAYLLNNDDDEDEDEDESEDEEEQQNQNKLRDDEDEQIEEELENIIDSEVSSSDSEKEDLKHDLRKSLLMQQQSIKNQKNNTKAQDINKLVSQIEEEDEELKPVEKEQKENEYVRAKHTKNQLLFWKQQTMDRISLQKSLDIVKRFPKNIQYFDKNEDLFQKKKSTELLLLQNLDLMLKNRQLLFEKLQTRKDNENEVKLQSFEYLEDYLIELKKQEKAKDYLKQQINLDSIVEDFQKSQELTKSYIEDNILKWSQKTNLISQNLKKSGFSQLLQTPIGQAQKAMKQAERMIIKSQLKREKFRILGKSEKNFNEDTDKNIFDDADYYHELLKEQLEEEGVDIQDESGLNINQTKIYLLERKLKQQERQADKAQNIGKVVDRRASKARKLRFNIHQKIVNFTNPIENIWLLEGRQEIIRSLFGEEVKQMKQKQQEQKQDEENSKNRRKSLDQEERQYTKSKKNKINKKQDDEEDQEQDDFQLI